MNLDAADGVSLIVSYFGCVYGSRVSVFVCTAGWIWVERGDGSVLVFALGANDVNVRVLFRSGNQRFTQLFGTGLGSLRSGKTDNVGRIVVKAAATVERRGQGLGHGGR